ncbi:MAG TPA: polysaccharide biosynthesis protein, partial [Deltaproteobacteria bacterium]|nr:polysaccharide biosynthesis protein [Deltaproteobacteria bacterium]
MFVKKRLLVLICDIFLAGLSIVLAFLLRFDFSIPPHYMPLFLKCLLVMLAVKPVVFVSIGFYNNLWRYASLQDAVEILKGVTLASALAVFAILFLHHFAPLPRSIFFIDWLLLFALIGTSRVLWRLYRENCIMPGAASGSRTLIVGAGEAGSMLLKEIRRQAQLTYNIIGFVDDAAEKQGMKLHGVPVLGTTKQLQQLINSHRISDIIIAMPSAGSKSIRSIVDSCKHSNTCIKTLPSIGNLIDGSLSVSQIKNVEIEDLLGRDPVRLDREQIGGYLTGKRVLVTGAAGSIGSEICR